MLRLRVGISVLAATLFAVSWLQGQEKQDTAPVRGTLPQGWRRIGLSPEQVQNVYRTRARYRSRIDALRQQISDLQKEERVELMKLLTDAQKARLREVRTGETTPPAKEKPAKGSGEKTAPTKGK